MRKIKIKSLGFLLLLLFTGSLALSAQDTTALVGTVTDSTGAVIPGTAVVLSNSLNGSTFTQTTDNKGYFRFNAVPTTTGYQLTFTHQGFAAERVVGITLNIGETRTQNATLKLSSVTTTAEVTANSAQVTLDTTDATIGNNIDVQELNDLPVYDRTRGISQLFYAQPGVNPNNGNVTGARADQSSSMLDGIDTNDPATGQTFYVIGGAPVDAVEQFTGTVAGLTPGTGTGSGGQYQLVTKSGTNHFHGLAYEYNRVTATTANSWFNNLNNVARTPLIQNQFGGNLGGPIWRDKAFFFFQYAGSRIVRSSSADHIVPLDAMRSGGLNYINNGPNCDKNARLNNAEASCISTYSAAQVAQLDPAAIGASQALVSLFSSRYPKATDLTVGDGVNTGGVPFTYSTGTNSGTYVAHVNYNLTHTQVLSARFNYFTQNAISAYCARQFATDPDTCPGLSKQYTFEVNHNWTIGSNKVNQLTLGESVSWLSANLIYNPLLPDIYNFSGGVISPYNSFAGQTRRTPIPQLRDDFSWQKGTHSITFGGDIRKVGIHTSLKGDYNNIDIGKYGTGLSGGLTVPTGTPALRPADINSASTATLDWDNTFPLLLGVIGETTRNYNYDNKGNALPAGTGSNRNYLHYEMEFYAGDTWKVTRKLTITYGLRYQRYTVPYEVNGLQSVLTPIPESTWFNDRIQQQNSGNFSNTGLPIFSYALGGKANKGAPMWNPPTHDFEPRLAFAYSPNSKTVVNASGGLVYDRTVVGALTFLQDQLSGIFTINSVENNIWSNTPTKQYDTLKNNPRVGGSGTGTNAALSYPSGVVAPAPKITIPLTLGVDSNGNLNGLANYDYAVGFDPNFKDPYSIALNAGVQQELPGNFVLKLNYVGRLGRRLMTTVDNSQILDAPDTTHKSNQTMVQAFADLTRQTRANPNQSSGFTPEPFFENMLGSEGTANGAADNTDMVAGDIGTLAQYGDLTDAIQTLAASGVWPTNLGMSSQLVINGYVNNASMSNYHGLLATLDKNMSHGLRFELNYTWSHSIDNYSQIANGGGLYSSTIYCDVTQPRACRGSSDFDIRQLVNAFFIYQLPFGKGKQFAGNAPRLLNELIGGWELSGLPSYRTGNAFSAMSNAYISSNNNQAFATWNGTNKSDLRTHVNFDPATKTVYMFAGGQNGANKVLSEFSGPVGLQYGNRNILTGPGAFMFDAGLGKDFPILEGIRLRFRADFFNVLNHPIYNVGGVNIVSNAAQFGQITGTANSSNMPTLTNTGARVGQFALRLEF